MTQGSCVYANLSILFCSHHQTEVSSSHDVGISSKHIAHSGTLVSVGLSKRFEPSWVGGECVSMLVLFARNACAIERACGIEIATSSVGTSQGAHTYQMVNATPNPKS